jgi:hypothetical protein
MKNGKVKERLWGLRALALAIAVGIWFGVSLSHRDAVAEKAIEATVNYVNKPRDVIVLDQVPNARVRVSGPDREIRQLAPYMVQVQVDLAGRGPGVASIPLGPSNVRLPEGLEVLSVEPNLLNLEIDREMTAVLPLKPTFTGEPAAGARVLFDQITIVPPQSRVTGPTQVVEGLDTLSLSPIRLDGHALSFEEVATVISPDPLVRIVENPQATVRIPMDLGTGGSPPEGGGL